VSLILGSASLKQLIFRNRGQFMKIEDRLLKNQADDYPNLELKL